MPHHRGDHVAGVAVLARTGGAVRCDPSGCGWSVSVIAVRNTSGSFPGVELRKASAPREDLCPRCCRSALSPDVVRADLEAGRLYLYCPGCDRPLAVGVRARARGADARCRAPVGPRRARCRVCETTEMLLPACPRVLGVPSLRAWPGLVALTSPPGPRTDGGARICGYAADPHRRGDPHRRACWTWPRCLLPIAAKRGMSGSASGVADELLVAGTAPSAWKHSWRRSLPARRG
jgi:hypothetical protein